MTTEYTGTLEIDHERGVIYFHTNDPEVVEQYRAQTILRIHGIETPIPNDRQIDLRINTVKKGE